MDTNEWSAEAVGIYTRLLFHQWVNGSIPEDHKTLAQITLVSIKKFSKSWPEMVSKFEFDDTCRGRNKRLEETRQQQKQYIEKQREKGKKRAEKMWEGHIAVATTSATKRLQPKDSPSSSTSSSTPLKKNNMFIIPTGEEIVSYCQERKNSVSPEKFLSYYQSNGWMVGKNKMKDWRAAIRTWEGNDNGRGSGNYIGSSGTTTQKEGRAKSDGKPYPVDHEF
jgi:uncharacterized protein YdaU (DUF1376 family)